MLCTDSAEDLRPYVAFHAALRASYQAFVSELESKVRTLLKGCGPSSTCHLGAGEAPAIIQP